YLVEPGAVGSSLAAQRLLDRGIDQDADDRRILRSRSDKRGMPGGPHISIDVARTGRDEIGARSELAFLGALAPIRHRRKPDIGVEADLMAGVVGKQRPAPRL